MQIFLQQLGANIITLILAGIYKSTLKPLNQNKANRKMSEREKEEERDNPIDTLKDIMEQGGDIEKEENPEEKERKNKIWQEAIGRMNESDTKLKRWTKKIMEDKDKENKTESTKGKEPKDPNWGKRRETKESTSEEEMESGEDTEGNDSPSENEEKETKTLGAERIEEDFKRLGIQIDKEKEDKGTQPEEQTNPEPPHKENINEKTKQSKRKQEKDEIERMKEIIEAQRKEIEGKEALRKQLEEKETITQQTLAKNEALELETKRLQEARLEEEKVRKETGKKHRKFQKETKEEIKTLQEDKEMMLREMSDNQAQLTELTEYCIEKEKQRYKQETDGHVTPLTDEENKSFVSAPTPDGSGHGYVGIIGGETKETLSKTIERHKWPNRNHFSSFDEYLKVLKSMTDRLLRKGYPDDLVADALDNHIMTTTLAEKYSGTQKDTTTIQGVLGGLAETDLIYQNTTPEERFDNVKKRKDEDHASYMSRLKTLYKEIARPDPDDSETEKERKLRIEIRKIKQQFYKGAEIPEDISRNLRTCNDLTQIAMIVEEDMEKRKTRTQYGPDTRQRYPYQHYGPNQPQNQPRPYQPRPYQQNDQRARNGYGYTNTRYQYQNYQNYQRQPYQPRGQWQGMRPQYQSNQQFPPVQQYQINQQHQMRPQHQQRQPFRPNGYHRPQYQHQQQHQQTHQHNRANHQPNDFRPNRGYNNNNNNPNDYRNNQSNTVTTPNASNNNSQRPTQQQEPTPNDNIATIARNQKRHDRKPNQAHNGRQDTRM